MELLALLPVAPWVSMLDSGGIGGLDAKAVFILPSRLDHLLRSLAGLHPGFEV